MMRQRVERREETMGGGDPGCVECGGGGRGPVHFELHAHHGDDCLSCGGPCRDSGPDACPACGRTLRFTLDFESPNGLGAEDGERLYS